MGAARESVGSGFLLEIPVQGEIRNRVPLGEFLEVVFSVTAHDLHVEALGDGRCE